jgi:tetratricopeptide (TPR) repeat protein
LSILTVGSIGYGFNFSESAERITNQYLEKRLLADCKLSIDIYEKFLSAEPDNPTALNNLAWVYATCEDTRLQNPQRALNLAKKATAIVEEPHILDTLAESYYINGHHAEAIAAATRALRLARDNLSYYEEQLTKFKQAGEF